VNPPELPESRGRGRSSFWISRLLLAGGVLLGVVLASEMGWLPTGHTVPVLRPAKPVPAVVPPAAVAGDEQGFVQVAKTVKPAVVNILATSSSRGSEGPHGAVPDDPFFHRFFGDEWFRRFEAPRTHKERSLGSGVIVQSDGLIMTNNHVVNQADDIKVFLSDKREFKAKLIGTDTKTDLAVVKIDADGLQTVRWADSDRLEVGELVLAVGNPFGLNQTVTMGIVSAVGRASMGIAEYEDFIQTDAAINPGNSGGPLVNVRGEVVGINTAIFSRSGGNMGIGFAVPSNLAHSVLEQLVRGGRVVRGWLGVSIQELSPELAAQFGLESTAGVLVSDVVEDSPAKKAGFERGDVVVEYDGKAVENPTQLRNAVAQTPIGKRVTVKVVRDKAPKSIEVTISEQPRTAAQNGSDRAQPGPPAGFLSERDVHEPTEAAATRYGLKTGPNGVVVVRVRTGGATSWSS
jgi:serine protease Do